MRCDGSDGEAQRTEAASSANAGKDKSAIIYPTIIQRTTQERQLAKIGESDQAKLRTTYEARRSGPSPSPPLWYLLII